MDLSGLKWPITIAVIVGIGWLATSGGVNWMYGGFTKASPNVDPQQDMKDEAGLTKLAGYTYFIWQWRKTITIIETAHNRYGESGENYWYNLQRLGNCYERIGEYQVAVDILGELIDARAWELDNRVGNFDNLGNQAGKLREMYELQ